MKASQFFISTLKEAPADAEIVSHKLMMRAGLIKKLGAGLYNYMPLGLRSIRKVENIIREELNKAGCVELAMPVVYPAVLWRDAWQQVHDEGRLLLRPRRGRRWQDLRRHVRGLHPHLRATGPALSRRGRRHRCHWR